MTRVNRRSNLAANRFFRQVQIRHHGHGFQTGDGIARTVGVNRSQRAIVTCVHGLQHVERFFATNFADDDAVGTHTQTVDDQLPLHDRALAFDVRGTAFQSHHVTLLQLQFGGIFDGDDSLLVRNVARKNVEQRCFAGACSARDHDIEARLHCPLEQFQHRRGQGLVRQQIFFR